MDCTQHKQTCDEFGVRGECGMWRSRLLACGSRAANTTNPLLKFCCGFHVTHHHHIAHRLPHSQVVWREQGAAGTRLTRGALAKTLLNLRLSCAPAGFPTLKWFGENKERPEEYSGGRDTGSLAAFATQHWSAQQPPPEVRAAPGVH